MTIGSAEKKDIRSSFRQKINDVFYADGVLNKKALIVLLLVILVILLAIIIRLHNGSKATPANIAGNYVLESVEGSGSGLSSEDIKQMKELDLEISLEVHDNGTAIMDVFGQTSNISYDTDKMTMNIEGQDATFKYRKGNLTIRQDGSEMVFRK